MCGIVGYVGTEVRAAGADGAAAPHVTARSPIGGLTAKACMSASAWGSATAAFL
jgi:hypothetical protein